MHQLTYNKAKENTLPSNMGCFIKGTLVETPEGWTPIDELKIGDLVMSRPENGIGEAVPKRVMNTFKYDQKEVWRLTFSQIKVPRASACATLSATPEHPFCVYGVVTNLFLDSPFGVLGKEDSIHYDKINVEHDDEWHEKFKELERLSKTQYEVSLYEKPIWKRVDQLERGDVVLDAENEYMVVEMARPYYAVAGSKPNHAWVQGYADKYGWEKKVTGGIYDLTLDAANQYTYQRAVELNAPNSTMLLSKDADGTLHYQPYFADVYNIEVEDTHTYLVGRAGILVHNTCGKTRAERMAEIQQA